MFWRVLPRKMWWVGFLLIVGIAIIFYLILSRGGKAIISQQILQRKQTIARAEASNLTSFFQIFGSAMAVQAQSNSMKTGDADVVREMDAFVNQWRDRNLIGGIIFTDSRGKVRFNSNVLGTRDVGASLADRDYFVWAKNKPGDTEYFIGQPVISRMGATKGQIIVPVAAAVYRQDVFVGVVAASVKLAPLTNRYLELMNVSDTTSVFLIDDTGKLLYSSVAPEMVGEPIRDRLPQFDSMFSPLGTTKEGKLLAHFPDFKFGKLQEHLIAYAPIELGSQHWLVVMATPLVDVFDFSPIYLRQIVVLVFASFTMLLFGILVVREK